MKISKLSTRLKEALEIRNMTAEQLSKECGFGKSNISHYVNEKHVPRVEAIFIIAKILEVDVGWLYGLDCPMEKRQNFEIKNDIPKEEQAFAIIKNVFGVQVQEILEKYLQMNQDGKSKLLTYLNDLLENPKNVEEKRERSLTG